MTSKRPRFTNSVSLEPQAASISKSFLEAHQKIWSFIPFNGLGRRDSSSEGCTHSTHHLPVNSRNPVHPPLERDPAERPRRNTILGVLKVVCYSERIFGTFQGKGDTSLCSEFREEISSNTSYICSWYVFFHDCYKPLGKIWSFGMCRMQPASAFRDGILTEFNTRISQLCLCILDIPSAIIRRHSPLVPNLK